MMPAKMFVGHLLHDNVGDGVTIVEDLKKRCPLCNQEYPADNSFCRTDGSLLEERSLRSPDARMARDADSGVWSVSGHAEEG
jgi:hypothetical protein